MDRPVMATFTGVPTFSLPPLLSTLSQISIVVLPGSSAGLISVTFAGTGSARPGTWISASVAELHLLGEALRHMGLGQQRRGVHDGNQRSARGCGFPGKKRTVGDYAVNGAADFGVADLRIGALELALGGGELALRGFERGFPAHLLHRLEVLGGGVVGGLRLHQRGLRGIEVPARDGALGEELLAALDDALVQVKIGLGLGKVEFRPLHIFGNLRLGGRGIRGFGGHEGALVVLGGSREVGIFERGQQLAFLHFGAALHIELAHRGGDLGLDGGLRQRREDGVGHDVLGDRPLLRLLGLHRNHGLGSGFLFTAGRTESATAPRRRRSVCHRWTSRRCGDWAGLWS